MAFFRTINFTEPLPSIEGDGVVLRTPQMTDFEEWAALREASRDFLTPWEPTWPDDDLTRGAFRRRIKRYAEDLRTDQGYAFLIARYADGALLGGLTLANIRRGVAQAGSLGYWMGLPFVRHGYMTAAVRAVDAIRLRELEAASRRSGLHPEQCRLDQASGENRLRPRGLCPGISVHQRHLAGSSALCPPEGRAQILTVAGLNHTASLSLPRLRGRVGSADALGWPRLVCYKIEGIAN